MDALNERYQRQILLPELGETGQQKLLQAKVLVIGAGGLGCPVLQYLVAAGVGTIGFVDDDIVEITNLHRQVLYDTTDIGLLKAERAVIKLNQLNPQVQLDAYCVRLTNGNALALIDGYDIVVDGTDNFTTRYVINDACVLLGKPLVYGAVSKFEGQVAVFNSKAADGSRTVNYRDLFPMPPAPGEVLNCAESGVLGIVPGIIGSLQANEVLKLITGIGEPLVNRMLTYNALNNQLFEIAIPLSANTASFIPKDETSFRNMDYEWACGVPQATEITAADFEAWLQQEGVAIIDVRERDELPELTGFSHLQVPLSQLNEAVPVIKEDTIIALCQSGMRSQQAATLLMRTFGEAKKIYSLKGGINALKKIQQ